MKRWVYLYLLGIACGAGGILTNLFGQEIGTGWRVLLWSVVVLGAFVAPIVAFHRILCAAQMRLHRWKEHKRDVDSQKQYLTNDAQGRNVSANLGEIIVAEIEHGLFDGRRFRSKLRSRVTSAMNQRLP